MADGNGVVMANQLPCLAVRGVSGVTMYDGPPTFDVNPTFTKYDWNSSTFRGLRRDDDYFLPCKAMAFSANGTYFAWLSGPTIKIAVCDSWEIVAVIETRDDNWNDNDIRQQCRMGKNCGLKFSPLGNYLMTWDGFFMIRKTDSTQRHQIRIWKSINGELLQSFPQENLSDWPQWSSDEKICGISEAGNVSLYENANFEISVEKINLGKGGKYRISSTNDPYHLLCFTPGKPSYATLYKYPNLSTVVQENFPTYSSHKAYGASLLWNNRGSDALVNITGFYNYTAEYWHKGLHYLNTEGEVIEVILSTVDGKPLDVDAKWSFNNSEFCVVYHSFRTSKAMIFNLNCEPVFEFDCKDCYHVHYNPNENILLLRVLSEKTSAKDSVEFIQVWDMNTKTMLACHAASQLELVEWSPDGEHFLTVSKRYGIWHYTAGLMHLSTCKEEHELWDVMWQRLPKKTLIENPEVSDTIEPEPRNDTDELDIFYRTANMLQECNYLMQSARETRKSRNKLACQSKQAKDFLLPARIVNEESKKAQSAEDLMTVDKSKSDLKAFDDSISNDQVTEDFPISENLLDADRTTSDHQISEKLMHADRTTSELQTNVTLMDTDQTKSELEIGDNSTDADRTMSELPPSEESVIDNKLRTPSSVEKIKLDHDYISNSSNKSKGPTLNIKKELDMDTSIINPPSIVETEPGTVSTGDDQTNVELEIAAVQDDSLNVHYAPDINDYDLTESTPRDEMIETIARLIGRISSMKELLAVGEPPNGICLNKIEVVLLTTENLAKDLDALIL